MFQGHLQAVGPACMVPQPMRTAIEKEEAWKRNWWWRCLQFCEFDEATGQTRRQAEAFRFEASAFNFWKAGEESAAWAYELLRRACPGKNLPVFYLLRSRAMWETERALAKDCKIFAVTNPLAVDSALSWFRPIVSYNLFADEKDVLAAFLYDFRAERDRQGIQKARARRGLSWHLVEAFDIWRNRWDGFDLNAATSEKAAWSESKRKQKEDACKRGKAFLPAFERVRVRIGKMGGLQWNPKRARGREQYFDPETGKTFAGTPTADLPVFLSYFDGAICEELLRKFGPSLTG